MAEPRESYILRYVKNEVDSYEDVKRFVKNWQRFILQARLNPSNESSSNITSYQLVYCILKLVETGDEEYIRSLKKECKHNRLMATDNSNITDNGFAILLPSCRFSLFVLRRHLVFLNGFEERDAAFILKKVLQTLSNLRDWCTHHDSLNTVHIYLDSDGNILVGYCDSLFKDATIPPTTGGPHNELFNIWQFGFLALKLIYPPNTCRVKETRWIDHLQKLQKVYDLQRKLRFTTCQAKKLVRW